MPLAMEKKRTYTIQDSFEGFLVTSVSFEIVFVFLTSIVITTTH